MKKKVKPFKDESPVVFLLLREKLGLKRYRKTAKRDEEKRKILLDLGLKKIAEKEKDDFILVGFRRRKVNIIPPEKNSPFPPEKNSPFPPEKQSLPDPARYNG